MEETKKVTVEVVDEKKLKPVVSQPATLKKKSEFEKFTDNFISEDAPKIKKFILDDVLIPTAKKTIQDIITNVLDIVLYGGRSPERNRSGVSATRYSYASYYDRDRRTYEERDRRYERQALNYDELTYNTRSDAERVLSGLRDTIRRYGRTTVLDLFDLSDRTGVYTDDRYGWTDLSYARVVPYRGVYMLDLPKPMPVDD